jgi:hypothetical protein
MKHLVLIHGRSQQMKDATTLKANWVDSLKQGLSNAGLPTTLDDTKIHFPYYGNALIDLIDKVPNPSPVILKGLQGSTPEQLFKFAVFTEVIENAVSDEELKTEEEYGNTEAARYIKKKGPLNWPWVLAGLRVIDTLKGGSGAVEAFTNDVYQYLTDDDIRDAINAQIQKFMTNEPTVVVSHSLGTIIAYALMKSAAGASWNISTLVTLGSPLAVSAVSERIRPLIKPDCVKNWYNGRDPEDTVALFPLRPTRFPVELTGAKDTINNTTNNHHGIESYLADPDVVRWIHDAIQ